MSTRAGKVVAHVKEKVVCTRVLGLSKAWEGDVAFQGWCFDIFGVLGRLIGVHVLRALALGMRAPLFRC